MPHNACSRDSGWLWTVRQAGLVLDHAPKLADQVLAGDLAFDAAHKQADFRIPAADLDAALD